MAKKIMESYEFGIKKSKKLGYEAVVLADNTHMVIGKKQVTFMFPKKKFKKIFLDQINNKKRDYIGVSFSEVELDAIMKGIEELSKVKGNTGGKKQ